MRPTYDELEAMAGRLEAMPRPSMLDTLEFCPHKAAAMLRACKGQVDFQERVAPWMQECFGPEISADRLERGDRFLEEALELLQSGGYTPERARALIEYVWARPVGDPAQEVGGVMVTLAAYCLAHDLDMHEAAEIELSRVWTKVDKIRAKQAAKPRGSALPVALEPATDHAEWDAAIEAAAKVAERRSTDGLSDDDPYNEGWRRCATITTAAVRNLKKGSGHD